jgi:hypothetical protein
MQGRLSVGFSLLAVATAAFGGTSAALSQDRAPGIPSNVPAGKLPASALSEETAVSINNLIGAPLAERAGISAASFERVRMLGTTRLGHLYLIPGTSGACLVIQDIAAACGDPTAKGVHSLSLLVKTSATGGTVGGGIVADHVRRLVADTSKGVVAMRLRNGVFVVDEQAGLGEVERVRAND